MEPLDVNTMIGEALEVTAYSLSTASIEVLPAFADDLPPVLADADQIRQVFTNLIVNAQHALEQVDGARQLRIATSHRSNSDQVVIKVEDNGPGIAADIGKRIFEPLFTTKEVGSGTGVGLALSHRIVALHGGTIELESAPDEGAAFVIELPCAAERAEAGAPASPAPDDRSVYRVLVVDDEFDVGQIITDVLAHDGHRVDVARSGEAGLEKIRQQPYDVVLSDIRMAGMDGPSFYKALSELAPEHIDRLAFITGDTLGPRVGDFLKTAKRPYLEKPMRPREIRALVQAVIQGKAR